MDLDLLNLFLVLLAAYGGGALAKRLGYPSVLGELLVGILLGPPLLGLLHGSEALAVLAEVGILLMMLYIGMEIDPRHLRKASLGGLLAATGGFITPFLLCYGLMVWAGVPPLAAMFVGVAAGVTSLATKSRILLDLGLLGTRIAHVMMVGALIADTASLVVFAAILGIAEVGTVDALGLGIVALKALAFFGVAAAFGLKVLPRVGAWVRGRERFGSTALFTLVLLVMLLFAEGAHLAGLHGILGAFVAGLFLREDIFGRRRAAEVVHLVRDSALGLLAPIFFVTAGFAVSLDVFTADLGLLLGVIALATIGKIVGTALFYLPTGHGWREGVTLGAGMNGRGAVEIIIAQIGLSMGLITPEVFSILVFMAIATTATVPVFLTWGVNWLRRRGELVEAEEARQGTLIVGAGPLARLTAGLLARSEPVTLLDRNTEAVALARAEGLTAVAGNALDEDVLDEAGAGSVRRLLALTPNPEVNTLAARLARTAFAVPDVHVLQGGEGGAARVLADHLGTRSLFAPGADLAAWDYRLDHALAERDSLAIRVPTPAHAVAERAVAEGSLPLAVRRGDVYLPFHGALALEPGDRVILLHDAEREPPAFDRFDHLVAHAPVLDLAGSADAEELFEMAAAALAPELGLEPDEAAHLLGEREAASSTVLLPGLAVPHLVIPTPGRFSLLLARSREGIVFPGQSERVHAVFILAGSEDERNFHLRALSAIAQVAQEDDFETRWHLASGAEALRRLVLETPRRRLVEEPVG